MPIVATMVTRRWRSTDGRVREKVGCRDQGSEHMRLSVMMGRGGIWYAEKEKKLGRDIWLPVML